jgi:hypothetical protein
MQIEDYTDPTDPYAPRKGASKLAAAAKRERQDDEPITPRVIPARRYVPFGVGAIVLIVLMIGAATYQLPGARPLAIATAPARMFQTSHQASQEARTATIAPTPLPAVMIPAYASPVGALLGEITADRQIVPVAHYGTGWIAYQDGAGLVWLRASDRPDLALIGPDLAPAGRGLTTSNEPKAPPPPAEPDKGTKQAPDRAARHAAAVARERQQHEVP